MAGTTNRQELNPITPRLRSYRSFVGYDTITPLLQLLIHQDAIDLL